MVWPAGLSHVSSPAFQDMVLELRVSCVAPSEVRGKRPMVIPYLPLWPRRSNELAFVEKLVFDI